MIGVFLILVVFALDKNSHDFVDTLSKAVDELSGTKEIADPFRRGDYLQKVNSKPEETVEGQQLAELKKLREELKQMRKEFDEERAYNTAYRSAEEHRTKIAERKAAIKGVIATFVVTVLAGIVLYYWPVIVSFVQNLFL